MGEITKTLHLNVPASVAYELIKEHFSRKWIGIYCADLEAGFLVDFTLTEDIPKSRVTFLATKRKISKTEETFTILPIEGSQCEITFKAKYRAVTESSARLHSIEVVGCLLMLERGFNAGIHQDDSR